MDFPKLEVASRSKSNVSSQFTNKFWKKYEKWMIDQSEYATVNMEFSPVHPGIVAVCHSTRVDFVDYHRREIKSTYSRIKDLVRSVNFRSDGELVTISDDSGCVQVVNYQTRTPMRHLKGHAGPVLASRFSLEKTRILSAGEDKVVKLWDVATGTQITEFDGHVDSVRSLQTIPLANGDGLIASGSYDGTVRLWDSRLVQNITVAGEVINKSQFTLQHGDPVESISFVPNSTLLLSVGGSNLKIWDLACGRLVDSLQVHATTVTGVTCSGDRSAYITCSLDNTIKVHSASTLELLHSWNVGGAVRCVSLSGDGCGLGYGVNGGFAVRRRKELEGVSDVAKSGLNGVGGVSVRLSSSVGSVVKRPLEDGGLLSYNPSNPNVLIVGKNAKARLNEAEILLKSFKYEEALLAALKSTNSEYVLTVLNELLRRGGLETALSSTNEEIVHLLLEFISNQLGKNILELSPIMDTLASLYKYKGDYLLTCTDVKVVKLLQKIRLRIKAEIKNTNTIIETNGIVEMLISSS